MGTKEHLLVTQTYCGVEALFRALVGRLHVEDHVALKSKDPMPDGLVLGFRVLNS